MFRLSSPHRRPVRNYFSRREQLRLLMLILPLGLVIILISQLHDWQTIDRVNSIPPLEKQHTLDPQPLLTEVHPSHKIVTRPVLFPGLRSELLPTIQDNSYFRNTEKEAWFHFLDILRQTSQDVLASRSTVVEYAQLIDQPDAYRGTAVTVVGIARQIEKQTPAANHLGLQAYFRVIIEPHHGVRWPIIVYCLELPATLSEGHQLSVDVKATGLFFKKLSYRWQNGLGTAPVILAKDIQPVQVFTDHTSVTLEPSGPTYDQRKPISASTSLESNAPLFSAPEDPSLGRSVLSQIGVDLETLKQIENRGRIRAKEKDVFYKILAAMERINERELIGIALNNLRIVRAEWEHRLKTSKTKTDELLAREVLRRTDEGYYSVAPLFNDPQDHIGRLFVFDGTARRAIQVEVTSEAVREVFNLDHYYEIDMFTSDSQNYPLVFCVRELPEKFPLGSSLHVPVRIAGFFFKDWLYRSQRPIEDQQKFGSPTGGRAQYAPLLIGRAPVMLALSGDHESVSQYVLAGLFALTLAGVWLAAIYVSRGDRRFCEKKLAAKFSPPVDQSPNEFNVLRTNEPM